MNTTMRTIRQALILSSSYIFGPLIAFLALGLLLDDYLGTGRVFLVAGLVLAFITTNVLLFRAVGRIKKENGL